jgi:hypothetical protein
VATTLVTGPGAQARERAIHTALQGCAAGGALPAAMPAVILEGLPSGDSFLDTLVAPARLARIAPGCLCCTGNLVLRVTLNRMLRQRPQHLFIGVARGEHLDQLRSWLQAEPYDQLLRLTPDLQA